MIHLSTRLKMRSFHKARVLNPTMSWHDAFSETGAGLEILLNLLLAQTSEQGKPILRNLQDILLKKGREPSFSRSHLCAVASGWALLSLLVRSGRCRGKQFGYFAVSQKCTESMPTMQAKRCANARSGIVLMPM